MRGLRIVPVLFGALFLWVILFGVLHFARANESAGNTEDLVAARSFQLQTKASSLADESVNVVTKGGEWRISNAALPMTRYAMPFRNSGGEISQADYLEGKAAPIAPRNTYVPGQCTWYTFNRRMMFGRPVGNFWGNGGGWHISAASQGYLVNHTPEVGAIFEEAGHVAFVEEVGLDNSVHISEMNWGYIPYRYSERWVKDASKYWYIH
ncbi:MAG: CHAP domain-containing protein [Candidatus Ancillula sp.]|nr:CHAP domain-containing protein [Candidatus Ancillula sp.]